MSMFLEEIGINPNIVENAWEWIEDAFYGAFVSDHIEKAKETAASALKGKENLCTRTIVEEMFKAAQNEVERNFDDLRVSWSYTENNESADISFEIKGAVLDILKDVDKMIYRTNDFFQSIMRSNLYESLDKNGDYMKELLTSEKYFDVWCSIDNGNLPTLYASTKELGGNFKDLNVAGISDEQYGENLLLPENSSDNLFFRFSDGKCMSMAS